MKPINKSTIVSKHLKIVIETMQDYLKQNFEQVTWTPGVLLLDMNF